MSTKAFERVVQAVKQQNYYVPREFKTVGGMWTVDTWRRDGITVQLMDEGWTTRIMATGLDVSQSGNEDFKYREGTFEDLIRAASQF